MSWPGLLRAALGPAVGTAIALAAVAPPMHAAADASLAAHMIQHLVLIVVAAPLLALGHPWRLALAVVPPSCRRRLAGAVRRLRIRGRHVRSVAIVGCLAHFIVVWAWHAPGLYEQALRIPSIHALEHLSLVGTACAFWSAVLSRHALGHAGAVLVLFAALAQGTALGALLTLAETPWYAAHVGGPPGGLTALEDQQLAGLFMWIPGGLVYAGAALAMLARVLRERPAGSRRLPAALILVVCFPVVACRTEPRVAAPIVLGDADRGRQAIERYGCGGCHTIPGIRGARGSVGPALADLGRRPYLAGSFVNEPAKFVEWVREPRRLDPTTIMPNLGVSDADARDIAALLYRTE